SFAVEQLRNKFAVPIQEALSLITGRPVAVQFTVLNSEKKTRARSERKAVTTVPELPRNWIESPEEPAAPAHPQQLELTSTPEHGLNPRYVFEKFVVGPNNRLAHAAALAVA